jgi:hypothetical protein
VPETIEIVIHPYLETIVIQMSFSLTFQCVFDVKHLEPLGRPSYECEDLFDQMSRVNLVGDRISSHFRETKFQPLFHVLKVILRTSNIDAS